MYFGLKYLSKVVLLALQILQAQCMEKYHSSHFNMMDVDSGMKHASSENSDCLAFNMMPAEDIVQAQKGNQLNIGRLNIPMQNEIQPFQNIDHHAQAHHGSSQGLEAHNHPIKKGSNETPTIGMKRFRYGSELETISNKRLIVDFAELKISESIEHSTKGNHFLLLQIL
ncbi:hypothetical protein PGTUg99_013718 [Puccinia graminis f. sp. tritici]|uniref:Uncharacterized protein n=1 Tax=Puccinia graminis f. sp. tritici TaxID=56615 RepID=A0A5B0LJK7_PUCGR|nr:hypothetical protein PGTUg99_013718 [Puccinia graminis f. sp. tritici]